MSTCKSTVVTSVGLLITVILFSISAHKAQSAVIKVAMNFMTANLPFTLVDLPTCLNRYQ